MRVNSIERAVSRSPSRSSDVDALVTHAHPIPAHEHSGNEPLHNFFWGIFLEKFSAVGTSNATVVTLTLTEVNGTDLTMVFSDGLTVLDVTPGATIILEVGTDQIPKTNYVYILQSGKVLAKSITEWPSAEHIKIGQFGVPSAQFVFDHNLIVNQNWNDGTDPVHGQGHLTDAMQRLRQFGGRYFSGIDPAGTSDYLTIAASNVEFKSSVGVIWQIHGHTFSAFDTTGGDLILVKNWNGDSYHDITDLFDIVNDSAGVSLANKWFKIVVWGIGNKEGELDFIVINLPNSSYTTEAKATEDKNNSADYDIPRQYSIESSTGFLICEIVVKQQTTWDYGSTKNLRGRSSSEVSGSVGTGITDHESLTGIVSDNHHAPTVAGDLDHNDLANIDAGDINHLSDAQVAVLHAAITTLTHTALTGKNAEANVKHLTDAQVSALHAIYTNAQAVTANAALILAHRSSNILFLRVANGAIYNSHVAHGIIQLPASDADANISVNIPIPETAGGTTGNLKILYSISDANAYLTNFAYGVLETGDNSSVSANIQTTTADDFPSGTANIHYTKTIAINDADFTAGDVFGVRIGSRASNAGNLYIIDIWLESD